MATNTEAPPTSRLLKKVDEEKIKKAFDLSHFDLNAVIRGAQLTLVGGMGHVLPPSSSPTHQE